MTKQERTLTAREHRRKDRFEAKVAELAQQGYEKRDLTVTPAAANAQGVLIMLPVLLLFCCLYAVVNWADFTLRFTLGSWVFLVLATIVLIVVHEGIHGLTWALFAPEHCGAIEFGVIWTMLMPYCTCNATLTRVQYILGAIMPTIVVGIIPAIVAIIWNSFVPFFVALLMILGGGGDALIVWKLLCYKEKGEGSIYMDHPYECGIVVFEPVSE